MAIWTNFMAERNRNSFDLSQSKVPADVNNVWTLLFQSSLDRDEHLKMMRIPVVKVISSISLSFEACFYFYLSRQNDCNGEFQNLFKQTNHDVVQKFFTSMALSI